MEKVGIQKYIAIEGNIGTGKTTLSKLLAHDLNAALILEQFEDNSFLPKFYQEPRRYAFPLEMSFLSERFHQLKNASVGYDLFIDEWIADYALLKSRVFARVNLDEDEYLLYLKMFQIVAPQVPQPDLVVYLHRPVHQLLLQIAKRGRPYEQDIQPSYLEQVQLMYLEDLRVFAKSKRVLVIELEQLSFLNDAEVYKSLKTMIRSEPLQPGFFVKTL